MRRLLQFSSAHPWLILVSILVITLLLGARLDELQVRISAVSLAVEDDPDWLRYQKSLQDFGDGEITVVLFQDPQLFTPPKLNKIQHAVTQLRGIPGVIKSDSLFSVPNIQLQDDYVTTDPFLKQIPQTKQALQKVLQQARLNPLVMDNLMTADGQVFALNLTLKPGDEDADFDHRISNAIEQVLIPLRPEFSNVMQIGSPFIRDAITREIKSEQIDIMLLSVAVLMVVLAVGIRSISGAILPVITAAVSITWTLAAMAIMDIPIGVMTSIVPALLIIIGSTEDIHIIAEYRACRALGMDSDISLERMSGNLGVAILLTFITTYFGFISIITNEIQLLKEFGLVASSGLLINFLITVLMVPAILKLLPRRKNQQQRAAGQKQLNPFQKLALFVFFQVRDNARITLALLLLLLVVFAYGAMLTRVNNNPLSYFKPDTDIVVNSNRLTQSLSGIETFSIVIETGIEDTFKKVRYLYELEKIQDYIHQSGAFDKSLSFNDVIKVIHVAMEGDSVDNIDQLYLPDSDALLRDYTNFVRHDLFSAYVTPDFSSARILVRHSIEDSSELKKASAQLQNFLDKHIDPALRIHITGSSIVRANGADYMASGQAKSLILMSLVIVLVVALLFVNWKAGAVALIPNLFPIVVLFGVMGFSGISLDTGTAMVAVISLGICVDDTVHFMTRYHHNTRNHNDPEAALRETVEDESTPIITTSLALMAGFASLSFSGFVPVENFGLLSALVMLLALLTTFVITPLLLTTTSLVTMWDMLSLKLQAQVVNDCSLFKGLSPWQIKQAILSSQVQFYQPDDVIITQGSIGDEMYVILEGHVSIKIVQDGGTVATINEIPAGGFFGEIALISQVPRVASVIAAQPTRLLAMRWEGIKRLSRYHPRISSVLFQNLASIAGKRLARKDKLTILRDEYTGAINRTFFRELMALEIHRAQRYQEPLTFLCFTLLLTLEDKEFNHLLRQLFEKVKGGTRKVDVYARWGDQRFVILLPRTSPDKATAIALRVKENAMHLLSCYQPEECLKMTLWSCHGDESLEQVMDKTESILNAPLPATGAGDSS